MDKQNFFFPESLRFSLKLSKELWEEFVDRKTHFALQRVQI